MKIKFLKVNCYDKGLPKVLKSSWPLQMLQA